MPKKLKNPEKSIEEQRSNEKSEEQESNEKSEETHVHWADNIALEVKKRVDNNPFLQKVVKKQGYVIYDEKTPSGIIHVGSGRGWLIHDAIAKTMRRYGMNAKFILSSDDIDPYDKPNKELPSSWNKYLGMPFRNIPSPVEGYESFGEYYFMQCVEKFEELGIEAEIESTGGEYEKGTFNKAIKTILDNHKKVQDIYKRLYGNEVAMGNKIPFNVICENCGRIATTLSTKWDKKNELISYECRNDVVEWAKGCGHKGEISPYNGNGKFPWKVEWAAKWPSKGVICEFAGKDHFTQGGSRTCAVAIANEVLDYPPPYPSTRISTGKGYEFFNIGGKKMSTSKGHGISFVEMMSILPPNLIRYLLIKSRPTAVIDFDPYKDDNIIYLFDRYDQTERIYFGEEKADERERKTHSRIYELSHVGKIPTKMPIQIQLKFAAAVIQIGMTEEKALDILKKLRHIPEDISGIDLHYVLQRLNDAKRWVDRFASENYKFKLREKIDETVKVDEKVKKALKLIVKKLKEKTWDAKELHNEFYEICKSMNLEPKDFFKGAYHVLINKDRGPQLANFILTIGIDKFRDIVEQL